MNYRYITLASHDLIEGVVLRKLKINKDESGTLIETLRTDWSDVIDAHMPFAMQYVSTTPSGQIRDQDKWHVHKNQIDRFICIGGKIVTVLYDSRQNTKTFKKLNLFVQSPENEEEMSLVVIPKDVYHGFMVTSKEPGILLNFPTALYNPEDELRIENTHFDWEKVKADFYLK